MLLTASQIANLIATSQNAKRLTKVSACIQQKRLAGIVSIATYARHANRQSAAAVLADSTLEGPISDWHKIAKNAEWQSLMDVRKVYPHADYVDPYTVFNIKGNTYRLIVKIEYKWQMIFIKHLLTHEEYDRGGWRL